MNAKSFGENIRAEGTRARRNWKLRINLQNSVG